MADGDSGTAVSTACYNPDLRARSPGRQINQQKMPAFSSETKQAVVGTEVPHPDPKFFFFMYLLSLGSESDRAHFGQADPCANHDSEKTKPTSIWSGPEMRALPRACEMESVRVHTRLPSFLSSSPSPLRVFCTSHLHTNAHHGVCFKDRRMLK